MSYYNVKRLKNIVALILVVVAVFLTVFGHLKYSWGGLLIQISGLAILLILTTIYNWKNK